MSRGLIGHSGFVGTTLLRQTFFDECFRRTDIDRIRGRSFELLVCAGAPAQKWIANREPEADGQNLERLTAALAEVRCQRLLLISTVDVFASPVGVDEATDVEAHNGGKLHAYGRHRRQLERFVQAHFERSLVVRLAGLVGPGLRKNVIFDVHNDNCLDRIDSRGVFQFYPMVNLWHDLRTAMDAGLSLVHLTAAPVSVAEVFAQGFGRPFSQHLPGAAARYDMRTRHAEVFAGSGAYQYTARESLLAIRAYAQSEAQARPVG